MYCYETNDTKDDGGVWSFPSSSNTIRASATVSKPYQYGQDVAKVYVDPPTKEGCNASSGVGRTGGAPAYLDESKFQATTDDRHLDAWSDVVMAQAKQDAEKKFLERNEKLIFRISESTNKSEIWLKRMNKFFYDYYYNSDDRLYEINDKSELDTVFAMMEIQLKRLSEGREVTRQDWEDLNDTTDVVMLKENADKDKDNTEVKEGDDLVLTDIYYWDFVKYRLVPLYDEFTAKVKELDKLEDAYRTFEELKYYKKSEL